MRGITNTYEIKSAFIEKIQKGEISKVLLNGYYTFPVYALNEDILDLVNKNDEAVGYVAVKSFSVLPKEDLSEDDIKDCGFESMDDFNLFTKDTLMVTVADVIPVIEDCDCEEEGCCGGDCVKDGQCTCGDKCQCK